VKHLTTEQLARRLMAIRTADSSESRAILEAIDRLRHPISAAFDEIQKDEAAFAATQKGNPT